MDLNGDSEISSEELMIASADFDVEFVSNPTLLQAEILMNLGLIEYQSIMNKVVEKYWYLIDLDHSGSLNFDEYKYIIAGMAAVDAGLVLNEKVQTLMKRCRGDKLKTSKSI